MADFTNDLLKDLAASIKTLAAATNSIDALGIPNAPLMPFFRMGDPLLIPVTPTSGGNRFPEEGKGNVPIPPNVTTFRIVNNNPFAIRLKGTKPGQTFQPVTSETGWLFMPGAVEIYTTTLPILMAAMSFDGPFAKTDPAQKAGTGVLELQYGTGA